MQMRRLWFAIFIAINSPKPKLHFFGRRPQKLNYSNEGAAPENDMNGDGKLTLGELLSGSRHRVWGRGGLVAAGNARRWPEYTDADAMTLVCYFYPSPKLHFF